MFRKLSTILLMLLILSSFAMAQNRAILRANGELITLQGNLDLKEAIQKSKFKTPSGEVAQHLFKTPVSVNGAVADTLAYYNGDHTSRFGLNCQDVMMTWYIAPADLRIKAVGIAAATDDIVGESTNSIRLVKLNYAPEVLLDQSVTFMGRFPAPNDGFGGFAAFPNEAEGDWQNLGTYTGGSPFGEDYDLWSEEGFGWPVKPEPFDADIPAYQWTSMSELGFEPEVKQGEIFAVVVVHDGLVLNGERIGYWAMDGAATGIYSWKWYEAGRNDVDGDGVADPGWWRREFTFDYPVAVELTSDRGPKINSFDKLLTTVSTSARTVTSWMTDDNPSGGAAGVASASIMVSVNGGDFTSVAMSLSSGTAEDGVWSGDIPGQAAGSEITYKISATDVGGITTESVTSTYNVFKPENTNGALAIYNGMTSLSRTTTLDGYWVPDTIDVNGHDIWIYGEVGAELLNNYKTILEVHGELGPADDNQSAITGWLGQGDKNYLLAGMEALGYLNGYTDSNFHAGDFEYDVLGVKTSYNDVVNYVAAGDELLPSEIKFVSGTVLGGPAAEVAGDAKIYFFPSDVYGSTRSNWMDVYDVRDDINAEVFAIGEDKNNGTLEKAAGHNYTDGKGNKIVFMTFDPLALEDTVTGDWYGGSIFSPLAQAGVWFGLTTVGVEDDVVSPNTYGLSQNYPNPFNPSTKIAFSVPSKSDVSLKIFNLLGQEVATLFQGVKTAGVHEVSFNASQLSSGVYFYTLKAGNFVSTRKMMLVK